MSSNLELIPIYTDWANKHLTKCSVNQFRPIRDISNDFRDYRLVSQLINVIVPSNEHSINFNRQIAKTTSNLDGLETCLEYLRNIGLDCTKLTKTDIDSGNLGAVLQLLYLLSTFKQKLRQIKKDQKKIIEKQKVSNMPPAVSKLPSPRAAIAHQNPNNSNFLANSQMSTTGIRAPTSRLVKPAGSLPTETKPKTSGLKPPSNSGIRPPSRSSGNNNVRTALSVKSLDSSSGYSSISSIRTTPKSPAISNNPSLKTPIKVASNTRIGGNSKLAPPKQVSLPKTASVKSIGPTAKSETDCSPDSGMLKLKLFNKNSPKLPKKTETKIGSPQIKGNSGLKPPTSKISNISSPKVNYRKTETIAVDRKNPKRCSKSSEEESGYVGFNSTSPASSSTEGSLSMHSASSKSSNSSQDDKSPSSDELTLNASIVTTIRNPVKSVEEKPILAVKGTKKDSSENEKSGPTVGVVSPMLPHKKLEIEKERTLVEKPAPSEEIVPTMAPIRQPPTYEQFIKQGNVTSPVRNYPTSEHPKLPSGLEANSLDRRMKKTKNSESSGYTSEGGIAMFTKMREKLKEYDDMTRRAQQGYPDTFEDSSSLSSGISDNIEYDDVSTSDLSGVDMTTVASKHSDYSHFVRTSTKSRSTSRPSTHSTIDSRSRTIAEQENIHKLLSQCRTSQRGSAATPASATFGQHSLKSPGYASFGPHLSVSADKETMSMHSNLVRRPASSAANKSYGGSTGFHSLDRKSHLQDYISSDNRIAALLSPRRIPNITKNESAYSSTTASLNASGMSRSMVLLETLSPRVPRRHHVDCATPRRSHSPRTPTTRLGLSVASPVHVKGSSRSRGSSTNGIYSTGIYGDSFQLHRLSDESHKSHHNSRSEMGSQLSLASTTAYASLNDKYECAIREMTRDLECYKSTVDNLTRKQENYGMMFDIFEQKLRKLTQHIEKSNLKPEEAHRFRQEIAHLRDISSHLANNVTPNNDGAGELLRQPSLESVASHRSSMSSSSKSSKQEKISLNSFGKSKKSWAFGVDSQIRSSLSKLTKKKKNYDAETHMPSISGSQGTLDNIDVIELQQELKERDTALTEVRLDALDRARQVDILKETVNKLKHENKQLKKEMDRLTNGPTRASSQASIPLGHDEEDPVYDAACSASSSSNSKRSSGCNSIKVTVNVDMTGEITSVVCPDNEIIVGYLTMPMNQSTWLDIDNTILHLFEAYLKRIDVESYLDLNPSNAILGYQIGDLRRIINDTVTRHTKQPSEILQPSTTIRMFMKGANQEQVDSLVLDTLLPRSMIVQLVKYVTKERRLVLAGAAGIGKSKLAKSLANYIALLTNQKQDNIVEVKIPDENTTTDELLRVQRRLEKILQSKNQTIVILDNIPKNRIAFVASVFTNVPLDSKDGPFVVCTVNRYQIPEMQILQNFKMFLMTNKMEGVNGFMLRFLRRRVVEAEYRQFRNTPSELIEIIHFLPAALQAVNQFIEKTNSIDVTIGPRVFLQCPLSIDESRQWFIRLWNDNFVPYMERVAREGKKTFGRCTSFDDPTDFVCEKWPWLDGPGPEEALRRLSLHDLTPSNPNGSKSQFNPLESLIQLHATKHPPIDNI